MKQYYVYILTNFTNTVLYTGVTNNLIKRVYEHKQKLVDGFTKKYHVDKLVYFEIFQDPENAIKKEKTIFGLEVTISTNAKSKEEGLELFRLLGLPIKEDKKEDKN